MVDINNDKACVRFTKTVLENIEFFEDNDIFIIHSGDISSIVRSGYKHYKHMSFGDAKVMDAQHISNCPDCTSNYVNFLKTKRVTENESLKETDGKYLKVYQNSSENQPINNHS